MLDFSTKDINSYLKSELETVPLSLMRGKAEILLQALVSDRIIFAADSQYLRNTALERVGVRISYKIGAADPTQHIEIYGNTTT